MALMDVIKYDGPADIFVWKHPNHELGTWSQLIVNESQEAVLFKGGQAYDLFTAGRHTLSTQNIPLLSKVINIPFGGNSPFTAEVWFVNKIHSLDVKWGTQYPMQLQDPQYKVMIPVRSFGQFGVQIEDSRKLLIKLVGTLSQFDKSTLVEYFRGLLMANIKELISSYLVHKKISILEISAYMTEIGKHVQERIAPTFDEYGIRVLNFYVRSINVPEDDTAVKRLKDALSKRAEMDIIGFDYQQERSFDTMEGAAKNEGGANAGVMGAGIGLGMGLGVGGAVGQGMSGLTNQLSFDSNNKVCPKCQRKNSGDAAFCSGCGQSMAVVSEEVSSQSSKEIRCNQCAAIIPSHSKFCPSCGDQYHPCPSCGTDNAPENTECSSCKKPMPRPCIHCGHSISAEARFCSNCGQSQVKKCSQCQAEAAPKQKFCMECGNQLD